MAGNAHTRYGDIHTSVTLSFAPDELSSIEGSAGATKAFNFGDLPCPPPDVAAADKYFYNPSFNPTRRYEPRILPPTQISQLDPAFNTCKFASDFQGFDPPHALTKVIGPIPGGRIRTHPKHKRFQRTTAHTHTTTQIPELQSKSNPTPSITASRFRHEAYHKRYQRVVEDAQAVTQPPEITAPPNLT